MATSKIKPKATYSQNTTKPIRFYKYGQVVMAILDMNNVTAQANEPISDIPDSYLPVYSFTTKEDLWNVRLGFDKDTKKVSPLQALNGENLRGIVTYISIVENG
jgi:hypothetical protein